MATEPPAEQVGRIVSKTCIPQSQHIHATFNTVIITTIINLSSLLLLIRPVL